QRSPGGAIDAGRGIPQRRDPVAGEGRVCRIAAPCNTAGGGANWQSPCSSTTRLRSHRRFKSVSAFRSDKRHSPPPQRTGPHRFAVVATPEFGALKKNSKNFQPDFKI